MIHPLNKSPPEREDKKTDKVEEMKERQAGVYEKDKGQRQDKSPLVLDIESKTDLSTVIKV
jgi:hypothetical protein